MVTRTLDRRSIEFHDEVNLMNSAYDSSQGPFARSLSRCARSLLALLLLATACGGSGNPSSPSRQPAARAAHALTSGANCEGTDVHTKHVNVFACTTCHPSGATFGFDVPYTFAGGTTTAGGSIVPKTATTPTTCTVACHFPKGAPAKTVAWNTPGPLDCSACHEPTAMPEGHPPVAANATASECRTCHPASGGHMDGTVTLIAHAAPWSDPASPEFHAFDANAGLAPCQACHGQDLAGSASIAGCGSCHDQNLPSGIASWKVNCVMCHGDPASPTGAPPAATWGNAADAVRVGAHAKHLAGSAIAPAYDCGVCHVKPADALAGGHLDSGPAELTFAGVALTRTTAAPSWDRASATCNGTYCHGAPIGGGTNTAPVWTHVGQGETGCGACHALPPPEHPSVGSDLTRCASCHPDTMTATGTIIAPAAGGKHLDGITQAAGGHGTGWMDTASASFHAYSANAGLAGCTGCHGANLDGIGGSTSVSCAQCHGASWQTSCQMCHGGVDNLTGAPPQATWGHETDPLRVGAHTAHLTAGPYANAVACTECHPTPANALAHADGSVAMTWGPRATTGGVVPTWDRAATSCTNYCHGASLATGTNTAPLWMADSIACNACHGLPPQQGAHWIHTSLACAKCHVQVVSTAKLIINKTLHLNGIRNVAFGGASGSYVPGNPSTCWSVSCHSGLEDGQGW